MKKICISILVLSLAVVGFAKDKKNEKPVEETFDARVKKEVERQVDLIKKKSVSQLAKELLSKERELNDKKQDLATREEQLKKGEESLLMKINELEKTKNKLIGCIDNNKRQESVRIKQLVSVISGMKPQKAAELLSVQESNISVKLLQQIDPGKASKIFNLMDKEVSARLQKQYLNMQQ